MPLNQLHNLERIKCKVQASSKKRILEDMCELLAKGQPNLDSDQIFNCMLERERLGSTGIGNGVAIPHSRMEGVEQAIVATATLAKSIDYNTHDGQHVDILFALLVPQECTDEHLNILASAAAMFSDSQFCDSIRNAETPQTIYKMLNQWQPQQSDTL